MSHLVAMTMNGETLGIHPDLVGAHENLGWAVGGDLPALRDPLDHDGDGKKGGSLPTRTPEEVLAMAEDATVPFMTFKAAAAKLLGDQTPAKKDDIVAALMELATQP